MALVEISPGAVTTLLLNRPEARNALSVELCEAISEAMERIDGDPGARVVMFKGAGPSFCSGADFAAISGPGGMDFLPAFERMLEAVARHRLPTIAVIQGAALGGGLQLATACDFRIAAGDAKLGIPSSRLGVVVNLENVERLVNLVGPTRAREVLMTGRTWDGSTAVDAGLVTAAGDDYEARAQELAESIARLAPLSVQGAKKTIQSILDRRAVRAHDSEAALEVDALVAEAYASEDLAEGIRAQGERRSPDFKGR